MDFNIETRNRQLDNLDQLIASSDDRIQSVLHYLGWTEETIEKEESMIQCPINVHHKIHPKSWHEHTEKCIIKMEGYDLRQQFLSESIDNPTQSISIDHNKKIEIITKELIEKGPAIRREKDYNFDEVIMQLNIKKPYSLIYPFSHYLAWNGIDPDPKTSDRLISTYSPDERLMFYNFAITNTTGPPPPPEFTTIYKKKQDEDKPPSYEEMLAQERDAKRRRAKYKSVHISKKNYTEVIREVINGQMDEYKEWLLGNEKPKDATEHKDGNIKTNSEEQERPHSSTSKNSNTSNRSRSSNRKCERYMERDRRDSSRDYYTSKRHRSNDRRRNISPLRKSYESIKHRNHNAIDRRYSPNERRSRRDNHFGRH